MLTVVLNPRNWVMARQINHGIADQYERTLQLGARPRTDTANNDVSFAVDTTILENGGKFDNAPQPDKPDADADSYSCPRGDPSLHV
jgi:hypothetical protein